MTFYGRRSRPYTAARLYRVGARPRFERIECRLDDAPSDLPWPLGRAAPTTQRMAPAPRPPVKLGSRLYPGGGRLHARADTIHSW